MAHKITESLRRTWQSQRDQFAEELPEVERVSGRTSAHAQELRTEIANMTKLLSYPVGTKFEAARDLL